MSSRIRNRSTARTPCSARHGSLLPRPSVAVLAALLAAGGAMTSMTHGQVLETYGRTLTAYSADSETLVGKVWPRDLQRGVNLDGTLRMPAVQPWALAGNPFSEGWDAKDRLQDIRLDTGTYSPTDVDIALPAPGFGWVIGRSFNGRQFDTSADYTSNGPQGKNWVQMSQAEIVFSTGPSASDDVVYIVYGADRCLEFQRTGPTSEVFKGKNGAAGLVKHTAGALNNPADLYDDVVEKYEYYDQNGYVTTFFGTYLSGKGEGQVWKITDPAGNSAYVGDPTDNVGRFHYESSTGGILRAYDTADRRYTYSYSGSAIGGVKRLTQVKVETKTGGTWASPTGLSTVAQVDYDYYTSTDDTNDIGLAGDLKTVTITTPLTDSGVDLVRTKYYRYYTRAYADSDGRRGEAHQVRMVMGYEGCRNKDWSDDGSLNSSYASVTFANEGTQLKPYAEAYFEYYAANDASNPLKLKSAYLHGLGGCGACGTGTYTLGYAKSSTCDTDRADTNYDTAWATRTVVGQPDGAYFTQYFDETGQALSHVLTDAAPTGYTKLWATYAARNSAGQLTAIHSPAQIGAGYTHDSGGSPAGSFTTSGSTGLVTTFNRVSGGSMDGFPEATLHREGTGTAYFDTWTQYTSRDMSVSGVTLSRPFIEKRRMYYAETSAYNTANTYDETSPVYLGMSDPSEWWSSTSTDVLYLVPMKLVTQEASVSSGKNGSGTANVTERYIREDGTTAFTKAQDGILTYTKLENGQVTLRIEDVNTTSGDIASADDYHDVFGQTEVDEGIHRKTAYAYDPQGRSDTTTMPDGHVAKMYYSKIGDGRTATIALPAYSSGTTTWYGPASYTVSNHAGKPGLRCMLAISGSGIDTTAMGKGFTYWITEGTSDPIDALFSDLSGAGRANIFNLSTTVYDDPGTRVTETRSYVNMISSGSWTGTAGTDYDAGTVIYDAMGRTIRTVDGTGTISRVGYDTPGRVYRRYVGTDDTGDAGSPMAGSNNMVKVEELEYDGGANADKGNGYLTKRTLYVENSTTDQRATTYTNDYRGRVLLQTNPAAPHVFNLFDTRGRLTATARYSSTASISTASDTPLSEAGGRVSLDETAYDERGQVYRTVRHKIDQADGSDDDSLTTDRWYDPAGRPMKVRGSEYSKTRYDRLGRVVAVYTLATDNDSDTYSSIYSSGQTDVGGDTVMEERVSWHDDDTGEVLVSATIMRHPTDTSTAGDLDSNADADDAKFTAGDIKGRIQITANWYDALHRVTSTVAYGTNQIVGNGSADVPHDFTRPASAPTASATALRTDYAYDTAGRATDVTDPRGKVARTVYDVAGRKTAAIANYVNGTPSGVTGDDDVYTRYVYSATHMTQMWADLDGDNNVDSDDQVTTYTYGVSKGAGAPDSKIASNRLLLKVVYPEQTAMQAEADRRVSFAYNAQGQEFWRKDQAANEFETVYDALGRVTIRKFTSINTAAGFDDAVKRIETAYLSRGLVDTVTQYDATSGGAALDQVQYTYDGWSPPNITKFEQDPDGVIGAGGRAAFSVQYALGKNAPSAGRQAVRRSTITLPGSLTLTYGYGTANGTNDRLSRVESLKAGSSELVNYTYAGQGWLVGTSLKEPQSYSNTFGGGSLGSYPYLDRFNRTTGSRWTKDLAGDVDFYSVDITYDENSNVTSTADNVQLSAAISGDHVFDTVYAIDGLNRVTEAAEGEKSGAGIDATKQSRVEDWTLTRTGNFQNNQLNLNWGADSDFTDNGEVDDTRTHNDANEITSWDPRGSTYKPVYDKTGNLTDDARDYKFTYDVLGRLRKVKNPSNNLVSEYRYDGLGYRIGWHYDATDSMGGSPDGTVDSSDPWYFFCYDTQWRIAATYRGSDSDPKERFLYHAAGLGGLDGRGGSSYIDAVVFRDRDDTNGWAGSADGVLEQRNYYCQNWRGDMSAVLTDAGEQVQSVEYFSYGMPFGVPVGDLDGDGDYDTTDDAIVSGWSSGYDVRADADLDGDVDGTDAAILAPLASTYLGRGVLTTDDLGNRKGFGGYENDGVLADSNTPNPGKTVASGRFWHARGGVFDSTLGRALQRSSSGGGGSLTMTLDFGTTRHGNCITACGMTGCFTSCWNTARSVRDTATWYGSDPPSIGPTAPTEDTAVIWCTTLPLPRLPGTPGSKHCYLECDGHFYSLTNEGTNPTGGGPACLSEDPVPPTGPGVDPTLPGLPTSPDRTIVHPGICKCVKAAYAANTFHTRCPWDYDFTRCNSNWFIGSLLQCCTGNRPERPAGAVGWNNCCRKSVNFACPGGPGPDQFRLPDADCNGNMVLN